ncbi:shikimate kinase [Rubinisphaera margarita]|uniref:shikimate kinase n=1 Tax=Rubinisphaera margarita TaxID=2909586 RepID=UPI001EE8784B|nr:shikimate kinase [Rubinisphaera margarita]MCG6157428.1 shikimate kinase [Rubinisphaera margarita]
MNEFTRKRNLVLIGMPGAGKSTIGVLLAKLTARDFVDTDVLIQLQEETTLQEIVDRRGYLELREIEAGVLGSLDLQNTVIATGGSAVYSDSAMEHLRTLGPIVYLKVELNELQNRVNNEAQRGLARPEGQSFAAMYRERCRLYEQYAEVTVECAGLTPDQIAAVIAEQT